MEVKAEGPSSTSSPGQKNWESNLPLAGVRSIHVRVLRTGAVEEGDGV